MLIVKIISHGKDNVISFVSKRLFFHVCQEQLHLPIAHKFLLTENFLTSAEIQSLQPALFLRDLVGLISRSEFRKAVILF